MFRTRLFIHTLAFYSLVLLSLSFEMDVRGQSANAAVQGTLARSVTDGVDVFSGQLEQVQPLITIGGRGEAKQGLYLPLRNPVWEVLEINSSISGDRRYGDYVAFQKTFFHDAYIRGGYASLGTLGAQTTKAGIMTWQSVTTLTFTANNGSVINFRDALTDGQPYDPTERGCNFYGYQQPNPPPSCSRGRIFRATDGSNATFVADADIYDILQQDPVNGQLINGQIVPTGTLFLSDGTRILYSHVTGTGADTFNAITKINDRNGNYLTFEYETQTGVRYRLLKKITDSMNRVVSLSYGDFTQASYFDEIIYKGFGGSERRIRIDYVAIENAMMPGQSLGTPLFPDVRTRCYILSSGATCDPTPGGPSGGSSATSIKVPSSIVLPNGQQYTFLYNKYLELARIKSPTGAYSDYTYTGLPGAQEDGFIPPLYGGGGTIYRRIGSVKTFDGSDQLVREKTFSSVPFNNQWVPDGLPSTDNIEIDVKDAAGSVVARSKHYFYADGGAAIGFSRKEYKTEILDPISQAVVRRTETTWKHRAPFPWCTGLSYNYTLYNCEQTIDSPYAPQVDPRITEVKTTLETGQVTKKTFTYDQYNNIVDSYDFDYGATTPLRHSHTEYVTASSYTSVGPGLLRLPSQTSVYDANNVERARLSFEYDNYSSDNNHAPLTPRSSISGLDSSFNTSYLTRGNRTATTQYLLATNGTVTGSVTSCAQYDVAGNIVKMINARGYASTFDFADHFGAPSGNAHSNSTPEELSPSGQLSYAFATSVTDSANHTSFGKFDYYTGTTVDTETVNGIISSAYSINEPLDRVTKIIRAVNTTHQNQTRIGYDDTARIQTTFTDLSTNTDGILVTKTISDSFGRPVETRQYEDGAHYIVSLQEYDALGRVARSSNPYRPWLNETVSWTEHTYDALDRPLTVTTPDTAVVRSVYDGDGVLLTDQAGKQRIIRENALGLVKDVWEITAADSETESVSFPGHTEVTSGYHTSYAYDALDQLTTVTQGSQSRTFTYDSLKRLIGQSSPEQGPLTFQHDEAGNLLVITDPRGVSTHTSYDSLNRPTRRWYNSSSSLSAINHNNPNLPFEIGLSNEVKFFYDAQTLPDGAATFARGPSTGQVVAVTYGTASSGDYYGYDDDGAAKLKVQQTGGVNFQITQVHNASGRITSTVYPSNHTVSYGYDGAGRTNSFIGNLGDNVSRNYSTSISYSSLGSLAQEQFGTSTPIYNKLFYNIRGQLSEIREGTTPNNTDFERGAIINFFGTCWGMCTGQPMPDNNGNLKRQEHWVKDSNGNVIAINAQAFEYDGLNRVKRAYEGDSTQPTWQQRYLFDRYGNRRVDVNGTTASLSPRAFELQTSTNRLLAPGDTNLAEANRQMRYDAAGNLTTDNYNGQGQRTYDADNHMTRAWAAGQWQTYTYDAGGRRVARNVNGSEMWQVFGLNDELVAEYPAGANPTLQKEYGYRNGQMLVVAGTGATTAPAPSALTAGPSSGGANVVLSWSPASGASNYRIERKGAGGSFVVAGTTGSTGLTDTGVSAGVAYLYRVCAANTQGDCTSNFSNIALGSAVSFPTDPSIISSADDPTGVSVTKVKAAHITELRTAVNAVRSLAGQAAAQWTNQTITATVTVISADDVRDLRTKLDEALTALGIQTSNYDDQTLSGAPNGTLIKKVHITQLRQRATSGTGGSGGSSSSAFTVQWLVADQLGTPRMIFDETGSLANTKRHDYLPFGEELMAAGRATTPGYGAYDGVRQKFTQYERDAETELDYAHARYYGSTQGRFTGPDPYNGSVNIQDPQSLNRYSYVQNNPLTFTDPSGLSLGESHFDPAFWGERIEFLPGFGTNWGSFSAFYEQQYETSMYQTLSDARARESQRQDPNNALIFIDGAVGTNGTSPWDNTEISDLQWEAAAEDPTYAPAYAQVPLSGAGYYAFGRRWVQWGDARALSALITFAASWIQDHPGFDIGFGEMSDANGGSPRPHGHHLLGLRIDIRPMRTDGAPSPTNYRDPLYSQSLTIELAQGLRAINGVQSILFNDPVLIRMGLTRHWDLHDNHLHVTFQY
ncbi:MAG TPA: hypothetical protein DC047_11180 [Blastocatellia bacterium]|nr:hypothetical protein [Blastocatellia bacterium]